MSDIRFDLRYMNSVLGEINKAENDVSDSIEGMRKIAVAMESELSSFSAEGIKATRKIQSFIFEIKDLLSELNRKISNAEKTREKEIDPPSKPSIPTNATPEQRNEILSTYYDAVSRIEEQNAKIRANNQRIDTYVSKCNEAKPNLEAQIRELHQIEESLKNEMDQVLPAVHEFMGQASSINNQGTRINSAMKEFNTAFRETYEDAERLYLMEPTVINGYSYNDKQFVIKNTHTHILSSNSVGVGFADSSTQSDESEETEEKPRSLDEEILIRDKDPEEFFKKITGIGKIKMPSSNLHRLGGKRFTEKMNNLGYILVTQPDGSTIDNNGMLHWEINDD